VRLARTDGTRFRTGDSTSSMALICAREFRKARAEVHPMGAVCAAQQIRQLDFYCGSSRDYPRVDGFPERQATNQRAARSFRQECDGTNPVQPHSVSADYDVAAASHRQALIQQKLGTPALRHCEQARYLISPCPYVYSTWRSNDNYQIASHVP
jgi:hypothetical protein